MCTLQITKFLGGGGDRYQLCFSIITKVLLQLTRLVRMDWLGGFSGMPADKSLVGLVEVDYTMNRQISDTLKQNLALIVHRYYRHIFFHRPLLQY